MIENFSAIPIIIDEAEEEVNVFVPINFDEKDKDSDKSKKRNIIELDPLDLTQDMKIQKNTLSKKS